MNNSILGNKTLYKTFLYCTKISSYVYALIQVIGIICFYLKVNTIIPSFIGGCSLITIVLLILISYVFNFCTTHRIPIYYIISVYLIGLLDLIFPLGDILILLRIYTLNIGLFLLIYIYVWYKYRNVPKIDNLLYFCKKYCDCKI